MIVSTMDIISVDPIHVIEVQEHSVTVFDEPHVWATETYYLPKVWSGSQFDFYPGNYPGTQKPGWYKHFKSESAARRFLRDHKEDHAPTDEDTKSFTMFSKPMLRAMIQKAQEREEGYPMELNSSDLQTIIRCFYIAYGSSEGDPELDRKIRDLFAGVAGRLEIEGV